MTAVDFAATPGVLVEPGDTVGGAYIGKSSKGPSVYQPWRVAAARGFIVANDAIMDGADLDILVLWTHSGITNTQILVSKGNVSPAAFEFRVINFNNVVLFHLSETGASSTNVGQYNGLGTLVAASRYAVRLAYDQTAQTITFTGYDFDAALAAATAAADDATVADVVAGLTPTTAAESDSTAAITTMNNGTGPLVIGGDATGASSDSIINPYRGGPIRYAKVDFDGGTVTMDAARDAYIGATTWTDATSGLTIARQATATQDDHAAISGAQATLDGDAFWATSLDHTGQTKWSWYAVITPSAGSADGDRIISTESAAGANGCWLAIDDGETTVTAGIGSGGTPVEVTSGAVLSAGTRAGVGLTVDLDANEMKVYAAGTLSAAADISTIGSITHALMEIGARASDDGIPYNGDIQMGTPIVDFGVVKTLAEFQARDSMFAL